MKKIEVISKYSSVRTVPKNLSRSDDNLFSHEYSKSFPSVNIIKANNAVIINLSIYNFKNLTLFIKQNYFSKPLKLRLFKDVIGNIIKSFGKKQKLKRGLWITDNKTSVYFHFLCDALTRYQTIPEEYKQYPVLLPFKYNLKWLTEILDTLSINYIVLNPNTRTVVEKAIVSSYSAPSGNFHKNTLLNLRQSFIQSYENNILIENNIKKVWIDMSRHRRPVQNIKDLQPILNKYNYVEVLFEELSIHEKINLLSNVDILVGSHSSGLTNMLFMRSGTKVVDIRDPKDNIKNAFFTMASELSIEYYYMERESGSSLIEIDPIKLDYLLSSLE
jgi:capsular polysaccharide biosynthesis protein